MTFAGDLRLVSINGSPRRPSRTGALVQVAGNAIAHATGAAWRHFELADIASETMTALTRDRLRPAGETIIREIEAASIILVGSPVYRASYTGCLKHIFDLVQYESLRGRIAGIIATGGNRHHGLVTEHQLRPLMSFFGMITAPTAIFAEEADFDGYALASLPVRERVNQLTRDIVRLTGARNTAVSTRAALIEDAIS